MENKNASKDQKIPEIQKPNDEAKKEIQNPIDRDLREKKYYKCTVPGCEMIFSKKCVLRDHQMAHKKEKPFKFQKKIL